MFELQFIFGFLFGAAIIFGPIQIEANAKSWETGPKPLQAAYKICAMLQPYCRFVALYILGIAVPAACLVGALILLIRMALNGSAD